jgi:hypothetical protein
MTGPVVALLGTGTTIVLRFQLERREATPLKATVLVPGVGPNPDPKIVTKVFAPPEIGDRLLIFGTTVNVTPLLGTPFAVTTTGPVVATVGTGTTIVVPFQLVAVATAPLNVTVLVP